MAGNQMADGKDADPDRRRLGSGKKKNYECMDCLLLIPGVSSWGCSVAALKTWCEISADQMLQGVQGFVPDKKGVEKLRAGDDETKDTLSVQQEILKIQSAADLEKWEAAHKHAGQHFLELKV
jgi:hypothetical protein